MPDSQHDHHGSTPGARSSSSSTGAPGAAPPCPRPPVDDNHDAERHIINPRGLHLRIDPERGRGVFSDNDVPAGAVLDEAPVLVLSKEQWERGDLDRTVLGSYGFCWSNGSMAIGLGLASMFNHSPAPNVNYIRNARAGTITFRTVRRVKAGDELCICYAADESKLWFTPSGTAARPVEDDGPIDPTLAIDLGALDDEVTEDAGIGTEDGTAEQEQGATSHAGRDTRRARYAAKRARAEQLAPAEAVSSTPPPSSSASSPPAAAAVSTTDSHQAPALTASLPPPLHSGGGPSRHAHAGPVTLVDPLPLDLELSGMAGEADWGVLQRVLGPLELEEDANAEATMDIWSIDVTDPTQIRLALQFIKEANIDDRDMRHLKRITRRRDADGKEHCLIALAGADVPPARLAASLRAFDPTLAALTLAAAPVPLTPARTAAQLRARAARGAWPTIFSPGPPRRPADARALSAAHLAWVRAGVARVLADAQAARDRGEMPVAVYCASPPERLWPAKPHDGFIPPTPGLRAAAHDTRVSQAHPLRHAVLNCVANIARLRTVPPFADAVPARNGADYLLTSLTLFTTHEPCVMCCMALLHSRVSQVFYVHPSNGGGFEGVYQVHGRKDLNHRFEVYRWRGEVEALDLPDGVEV
ncbi:tRNA-specific adenosine deaminase subunit tad3 [Cryptotrichosporon argae]